MTRPSPSNVAVNGTAVVPSGDHPDPPFQYASPPIRTTAAVGVEVQVRAQLVAAAPGAASAGDRLADRNERRRIRRRARRRRYPPSPSRSCPYRVELRQRVDADQSIRVDVMHHRHGEPLGRRPFEPSTSVAVTVTTTAPTDNGVTATTLPATATAATAGDDDSAA